jgi:hypothetical protein
LYGKAAQFKLSPFSTPRWALWQGIFGNKRRFRREMRSIIQKNRAVQADPFYPIVGLVIP